MARVNYQRDKRQKDLARQQKQEEKRQRRQQRSHGEAASEPEGAAAEGQPAESPETAPDAS